MNHIRSISLGRLIWWWAPPLFLMGLLYYLSSRPTVAVGNAAWTNFLFYKSIHVGAYGTLTYFLFRALFLSLKQRAGMLVLLSLASIIAFFWGISDEYRQMSVPGRTPSTRDALINAVGICLASVSLYCQRGRIHSILFP